MLIFAFILFLLGIMLINQAAENHYLSKLFGLLCFGTGIIIFILNINNKSDFKPLYQVDPKQDSYIILNGEIYDTVPYGKLEEYIQNDNL